MEPRQIVTAAFRFEPTDPVPYWIRLDDELRQRLDEHYGSDRWAARLVPYLYGYHVGHRTQPVEGGLAQDLFGTVLQTGNILHVERPALVQPSLRGYHWPDPEDVADWSALAAEYAGQRASFRLCGLAMGLFERAWLMRGFESFLVDMLERPAFVEELLDGILQMHLEVMERIASRIPIEAYFGGDDWCDQRGVIMGVGLWRRFFKPRLARLVARCHDLGLPYVLHSCGNVAPLAEDLIEIGVDALESVQPEAMDVYALKQATAGRLVLIGGMGVQSVLPFGTPEQVRAETRRLIRQLGRGGGYVLAPAKPLMSDVPVANAVAFIETACQRRGNGEA